MKKIAICMTLLIVSTSVAYAASYSDVDPRMHKYGSSIKNSFYFSGYPDGTFKPDKILNRAELLKMAIEDDYPRYAEEGLIDGYGEQNCFKDVPKGEWYTKYVCFGKEKGYVQGYSDGTFRPSNEVNLVEAVKMLYVGKHSAEPEQTDPWYKYYIEAMEHFIPLDFARFDQKVTRAQMADMMHRAHLDRAWAEEDLGFLYPYTVRYDDLVRYSNPEEMADRVHKNKDEEARTISKFSASAVRQEVSLYDYTGQRAVLFSFNAEKKVNTNCPGNPEYFSGDFSIATVTKNDEILEETRLTKMNIQSNAIYSITDPALVIIEEYNPKSCTTKKLIFYSLDDYKPNRLEQIEFSDITSEKFNDYEKTLKAKAEAHRINIDSIDSLKIRGNSMTVEFKGITTIYKQNTWDNNYQFMGSITDREKIQSIQLLGEGMCVVLDETKSVEAVRQIIETELPIKYGLTKDRADEIIDLLELNGTIKHRSFYIAGLYGRSICPGAIIREDLWESRTWWFLDGINEYMIQADDYHNVENVTWQESNEHLENKIYLRSFGFHTIEQGTTYMNAFESGDVERDLHWDHYKIIQEDSLIMIIESQSKAKVNELYKLFQAQGEEAESLKEGVFDISEN